MSKSNPGNGGFVTASGGNLASLFPGDDSSDSDQECIINFHRTSGNASSPSKAKLGVAVAAVGSKYQFPSLECGGNESINDPIGPAGNESSNGGASSSTSPTVIAGHTLRSSRQVGNVEGKEQKGVDQKLSIGWGKKSTTKKDVKNGARDQGETTKSPFHPHMGLVPLGHEADNLEASRQRASLTSTASSKFELNKRRSPAEWMRVGDTTGVAFLWYTIALQATSALASFVYLTSAEEDQLSWKIGCWGDWTSLSDAENVHYVEFDTNIGWQLFGKDDHFSLLGDVSKHTAIAGGLAGGMHTLVVLFSFTFFLFSLSALYLSYGTGSDDKEVKMGTEGDKVPQKRETPLVLGRACHRWMFVMALFDIFSGIWCFSVGCAWFYFVVTQDFTQGLQKVVRAWGENVSCAAPQTSPRYGFFTNAVAVLLLVGGGTISLFRTYASDSELSEVVEMWENDRTETAEIEARKAIIKKRENFATVAATAAQAARGVGVGRAGKKGGGALALFPTIHERKDNHSLPSSAVWSDGIATGGKEVIEPLPLDMQSPQPRLENVDLDTTSDLEKGAAVGGPTLDEEDDDQPPPKGWDVRMTPSGEKFWVNITTKEVSWDRPSA